MASFYANPNDKFEPWIERAISHDIRFRIWHVILFCFAGVTILVVFVCCCVKFRIPRTKQEIEADYQRKKIVSKFKEKLKLIKNQDMDAMDLQRALEIIQEDLCKDNKTVDKSIEIESKPSTNFI